MTFEEWKAAMIVRNPVLGRAEVPRFTHAGFWAVCRQAWEMGRKEDKNAPNAPRQAASAIPDVPDFLRGLFDGGKR